jgi:carbonic anhydrase
MPHGPPHADADGPPAAARASTRAADAATLQRVRKLLLGIDEFRRTRRAAYTETFARLALGQEPDTLAIACSDSRISAVEFATNEPGDVFVVRTVGNLVPPYVEDDASHAPAVGAAIEYALTALPIDDIVVCGHSACGAMRAIQKGTMPEGTPHLAAWLEYGRRVLDGLSPPPAGLSPLDHLSQQSVLRQLENLRTYPAVVEAERAGRLRLHGWWFDIARAEVLEFDREARRFVVLDEARIARLLAEQDRRHVK